MFLSQPGKTVERSLPWQPYISCLLSSSLKNWKPHQKSHIHCSLWTVQQLRFMADVDAKSWSVSCLEMQAPLFAFQWKRLACFPSQKANLSHSHGAALRLLTGRLVMGWRFLLLQANFGASSDLFISGAVRHSWKPKTECEKICLWLNM